MGWERGYRENVKKTAEGVPSAVFVFGFFEEKKYGVGRGLAPAEISKSKRYQTFFAYSGGSKPPPYDLFV